MTLNIYQENFINIVKDKVKKKDTGLICLNSAAGCGKTYSIKYLVENIDIPFFILGPTHTSKEQLIAKGLKNVKTAHSFLNYRQIINKYTGVQTFQSTRIPVIPHYSLIICDECSLINDEMYNIFKTLSNENLVIFSGDENQLPPVDETRSIEDSGKYSLTFEGEKVELLLNERQKNSLNDDAFNALEAINNDMMPVISKNIRKAAMLDAFKQKSDKRSDKTKIVLAYHNNKVAYWNNMIRTELFGNGSRILEDFYINETLIFSGSRQVGNISYRTGDKIHIIGIEKVSKKLKFIECCHTIEANKLIPGTKACQDCDIKGHHTKYATIDFYEIIDENDSIWYQAIEKQKLSTFMTSVKKYSLKNQDWGLFYELKEEFQHELKYEYCRTIHSSQGQEYDYVFVDVKDIKSARMDKSSKRKAMYTAITRLKRAAYNLSAF